MIKLSVLIKPYEWTKIVDIFNCNNKLIIINDRKVYGKYYELTYNEDESITIIWFNQIAKKELYECYNSISILDEAELEIQQLLCPINEIINNKQNNFL